MKKRITFVLILFIGLQLFSKAQLADPNGFLVRVGDQAPDFSAVLTDGSQFKLSEHRGKIVMLQFTASWCSVCRKEMPFIERDIWQKLKKTDFVLVGIDRDETLEVVKKFKTDMQISYPLALDPGAEIFGLYADLQAGVTRNIIIDENGFIIFLSRLYKEDEFEEMVDTIFDAIEDLE